MRLMQPGRDRNLGKHSMRLGPGWWKSLATAAAKLDGKASRPVRQAPLLRSTSKVVDKVGTLRYLTLHRH